MIGKTPFEFMLPEDRENALKIFKATTGAQSSFKGLETRSFDSSGRLIVLETSGIPFFDGDGKLIGYRGISRDITDQKEAEKTLRESEEKYRLVVDNANEVIVVAQDGMIKFFNPKLLQMTGYSPEEVASIPFIDFVYLEDRKMIIERYQKRLKGEVVTPTYELRVIRKNGIVRWVMMNAVLITWESRPAVLNIFTDITEEKQLRDEKENFTRKLIEVQEAERKRISRDLHDETAQYLALLTLEIDSLLGKKSNLSPETAAHLEKLKGTAEKTLQEVRRFSHELRPSVLEHFGLPEALELLVNEFNERGDTQANFKISGEENRLKEDIELVLFRITQEALSNIRKHSEADKAEVRLRFMAGKVRLTISDDGKGFQASEKKTPGIKGGLGLISMRERAQLIGAKLSIKSNIDKGTILSVEVPT